MMCFLRKSFWVAAVVLLALSSSAVAQGIAPGSLDIAGSIGYAHVNGITSKNHVSFGPSVVYNLNPIVAVGGEYNYQPLGTQTIFPGFTGTAHLQTYGGLARFSLTKSPRVVPYALVGFGGADLYTAVSVLNVSFGVSQKGYNLALGGGAALFAGPRWGIRPEFRYQRQHFNSTTIGGSSVGSFGQNDVQATVSVFYQFGSGSSRRN